MTSEKFSIDSSAVVAGLASGLVTYCKKENTDYLACKAGNQDPEKCLKEAIESRKCAFKLYVVSGFFFQQTTKILRNFFLKQKS